MYSWLFFPFPLMNKLLWLRILWIWRLVSSLDKPLLTNTSPKIFDFCLKKTKALLIFSQEVFDKQNYIYENFYIYLVRSISYYISCCGKCGSWIGAAYQRDGPSQELPVSRADWLHSKTAVAAPRRLPYKATKQSIANCVYISACLMCFSLAIVMPELINSNKTIDWVSGQTLEIGISNGIVINSHCVWVYLCVWLLDHLRLATRCQGCRRGKESARVGYGSRRQIDRRRRAEREREEQKCIVKD